MTDIPPEPDDEIAAHFMAQKPSIKLDRAFVKRVARHMATHPSGYCTNVYSETSRGVRVTFACTLPDKHECRCLYEPLDSDQFRQAMGLRPLPSLLHIAATILASASFFALIFLRHQMRHWSMFMACAFAAFAFLEIRERRKRIARNDADYARRWPKLPDPGGSQ